MDKEREPVQDTFAERRAQMVQQQLVRRGIRNSAVLKAMGAVPRERFVRSRHRSLAYEDTPLPIPGRQTISQPYVVALMLSKLNLENEDRVLEVGTGSGYVAAVLSRLVAEVHTVERLPELVHYATERLQALSCQNVHVHQGDGTLGWPPAAPYDAIVVAAGGPTVPQSLRSQLAVGGQLIIPVGSSERRQYLVRVTRSGQDTFEQVELGAVAFVPLIGEEGWPH